MKNIFKLISEQLIINNFEILFFDNNRPWGGFFVVAEDQAQQFLDTYFDGLDLLTINKCNLLSPKIEKSFRVTQFYRYAISFV